MKTLLTAIDLSPITHKVIDEAGRLAAALQAQMILLHVIEPALAYVPVGAAMDVITTPMPIEPPDLEASKNRLEEIAAPLRSNGLSIETRVVVSNPTEEILDQATSLDADLIILGSHGHGALYHLFSGSVVTSVLQKSTIPVTVIPVHQLKG